MDAAAETIGSLHDGGTKLVTAWAAVHEQLARTRTAMGRRRDAVAHCASFWYSSAVF
jgi:hypothetical protein